MQDFQTFLKQAANVRPSQRQMQWFDTEFYAFVHFSPNTYTGLEWGTGQEDPAIFNPTELDCDQWVEAIKSAGMKGMVLTAKHHDGFCLWPSAYTEHSVKNSPCGKDIVKEAAEACRRGGIKFGFYLSPWDRNCALYGTPEYNDYYCNQLTELLTGYGDIFCVWFDGACGEGPNGKKQVYDFERYIALIRQYQPDAVIFNDGGPDVRWVGNEAGKARHAEWAVVPSELCMRAEVQTGAGPLSGDLSYMYNTDPNVGCLANILYSKGLTFCPSEVDMSIRPGWFFHDTEQPHSLERLIHTYLTTVGGNTCFNLNIPPMPSGRFHEADVQRLKELGDWIRTSFAQNLADGISVTYEEISDTQANWTLNFAEEQSVRFVTLQEEIEQGQRVETFQIRALAENGTYQTIYQDTVIGHKKICALPRPVQTKQLIIAVTAARDTVSLKDIQVY